MKDVLEQVSALDSWLLPVAVVVGLWLARRSGRPLAGSYARATLLGLLMLACFVPSAWLELATRGQPGALALSVMVFAPVYGLGILGAHHLNPSRPAFPLLLEGDRRLRGWKVAALLGVASVAWTAALWLVFRSEGAHDAAAAAHPAMIRIPARVLDGLFGSMDEELQYRGLLLALLLRVSGSRAWWVAAATVTAWLWAIAHLDQWDLWQVRVLMLTFKGVLLAWLASKYSVEAAIVTHLVHNLLVYPVSFLLVWAGLT